MPGKGLNRSAVGKPGILVHEPSAPATRPIDSDFATCLLRSRAYSQAWLHLEAGSARPIISQSSGTPAKTLRPLPIYPMVGSWDGDQVACDRYALIIRSTRRRKAPIRSGSTTLMAYPNSCTESTSRRRSPPVLSGDAPVGHPILPE